MDTQQRFETGHQPVQRSIEQRVLLLKPDEFAQKIMWRRTRFAELQVGKAVERIPDEAKQLAHEIEVLSKRATLLQNDNSLPDLGSVAERLQEIETQVQQSALKPNADLTRQALEIRRQVLLARAESIKKNGPVIQIKEYRKWKAEARINGRALPLDQWKQVSPRLVNNPDVNLNEAEEFKWYMSSLSPEKRKEVVSLLVQMKAIDDQVRAVVCMPAYKEGKNIYRTLNNYAGLKEADGKTPFNYRKLRIVIFSNWPEGNAPDNIETEVQRFMKDHPGVQIDFIKARIADSAATIANYRNIMTAAVIENAAIHRKKPIGDLVYVSNDADMPDNAIKPTYVADIIHEFDTDPYMDALAGKINFPEKLMARVPVQYATRRLWQYMDLVHMYKSRKEPFLVGRNSAMRLKMIAAVGNYDPVDTAGEDVEIGNKIKWARSWVKKDRRFDRERIKGRSSQSRNRVRYVHRISMNSDPRRDLIQLLSGRRIKHQYAAFHEDQSVRGKHGEELVEKAEAKGLGSFNRNLFEQEAAAFYYDAISWAKHGGLDAFKRAMGLVGAKYEVRNGKFMLTDTSMLEKNLQLAEFRELHKYRIEQWLGKRIKRMDTIATGVNNRVFQLVLDDGTPRGKSVILRMSTQKERKKFTSERWASEQAATQGVPVAKVVKLDEEDKVIPGWSLVVSERLPGSPLVQSYTRPDSVVSDAMLSQMGRALRKINSVEIIKGYGYLNENGEGYSPTWESFVMKPFDLSYFSGLVQKGLIRESDITMAIHLAYASRASFANAPRRLLHGDYSLGNILQNKGTISGVLDWENAKSGDPLWDLAYMMVYHRRPIGGERGLKQFLIGYGRPELLSQREARAKFSAYKLSNILYALKWQGERANTDIASVNFLGQRLSETLEEVRSTYRITTPVVSEVKAEAVRFDPISRQGINRLLQKRFQEAVDWFKDFYAKGMQAKDQEYITARERYEKIRPIIETALSSPTGTNRKALFDEMRRDGNVTLSDDELNRQIERLVRVYRSSPAGFRNIDLNNPAFRFLMYARNRGHLNRYVREYNHIPGVNFLQVVQNLARSKAVSGQTMRIMDEGGTMDLGLQQLGEELQRQENRLRLGLSSIAADDMAVRFADCHRLTVQHRMEDVHKLTQVFPGEKQSLIISQAAYKFFWDPLGTIVQTANALERNGWAFLGDIQENVSYSFSNLFIDENGRPLDPVRVFEHLNSLNLGYKFYVAIHDVQGMGDNRKALTLAIRKDTDKDLNLPMFYGQRQKKSNESTWISPLAYVVPSSSSAQNKLTGYTKI